MSLFLEFRDTRAYEKLNKKFRMNYKEKIAKIFILEKKRIQRENQIKIFEEKMEIQKKKNLEKEKLKLFGIKNGRCKKKSRDKKEKYSCAN